MLYNPTHDIPQLLTVERLKMWLDTQPPEEYYDYRKCSDCLIAKYLRWYLNQEITVNPLEVTVNGITYSLPAKIDLIAHDGTQTFGEAAKRAASVLGN